MCCRIKLVLVKYLCVFPSSNELFECTRSFVIFGLWEEKKKWVLLYFCFTQPPSITGNYVESLTKLWRCLQFFYIRETSTWSFFFFPRRQVNNTEKRPLSNAFNFEIYISTKLPSDFHLPSSSSCCVLLFFFLTISILFIRLSHPY